MSKPKKRAKKPRAKPPKKSARAMRDSNTDYMLDRVYWKCTLW